MRLCQPYFRALTRSFAAVWLLSGIMTLSWIAAMIALARLIDAYLAHAPLSALLPLITLMMTAGSGALIVQLARGTLLNRRRVWLEHGLGEAVLAHELWRGSDARHRNRSLAAVHTVSRFTGGQAATAISEAPWAIAVIGGLWSLNADIATVASVAILLQLSLALAGSRITRAARQFDTQMTALAAGQDIMRTAPLDHGASLDLARQVASRWEMTQRGRMGVQYAEAQLRNRLIVLSSIINVAAALALAVVTLGAASSGLTAGALCATFLVAIGALLTLSGWSVDASSCAAARAAKRQLATLRVARTRGGEARLTSVAPPDLRAPIAASIFATAATAGGLMMAVSYWQLPVLPLVRDALATTVTTSPNAAQTVEKSKLETEILRLRSDLTASQFRLAELRQEAETLQRNHPTARPAPALMQSIETAKSQLTTSVGTMLERLARLERELATMAGTSAVPSSPSSSAPKGLS